MFTIQSNLDAHKANGSDVTNSNQPVIEAQTVCSEIRTSEEFFHSSHMYVRCGPDVWGCEYGG